MPTEYTADHHSNVSVTKARRLSMKLEPNRRLSKKLDPKEGEPPAEAAKSTDDPKKPKRTSMIVIGAEAMRQRQKALYEQGKSPEEKDYHTSVHTLTPEALAKSQNCEFGKDGYQCKDGPAGLDTKETPTLQSVVGKNQITPPKKENIWVRLLKQVFTGIFNVLLWGTVVAEMILIYSGNSTDIVTPIILASVVIAAGFLQWWTELQAENLMDALSGMQSTEPVQVVRRENGQRKDLMLDAIELLPGDICFLKSGDRVPADVRILACTDGMEVDNAALTGESMPEPRDLAVCEEGSGPSHARNLAFYGTTVVKGNATCMVFFIGDSTFLGKIAASIKSARSKSTLEIQIEHFVHLIAIVAIIVGLASLIANLLNPVKHTMGYIIANAVGALFAQVPEGLIPTVTISLMIASKTMSVRHVLIRKLDAVETLGCVSVVCSDKTGTLTSGEMTLRDLATFDSSGEVIICDDFSGLQKGDESSLPAKMLKQGIRNNATVINGPGKYVGSPTEQALIKAGVATWTMNSVKDIMDNLTLYEIPFDSANKYMFVAEQVDDAHQTFNLKGAPERVTKFCTSVYVGDGQTVVPYDAAMQQKVEAAAKKLMNNARRVLAIAEKKENKPTDFEWDSITGDQAKEVLLNDMVLIGLFGIQDPPKKGVKEAVEDCHRAGCKVIMITGDHPDTGTAIAKEISILESNKELPPFTVITDKDLNDKCPTGDNFEDEDFDNESKRLAEFWKQVVIHARVFARVTPIHKQLIVSALQKWGAMQPDGKAIGDIVAMTGDGVNDAPALKQANVGIAMGIRGTAVAKDASDIILLDDEFSSIVVGIEQGRLSSENLQKSIAYTLCSKVPQCLPNFLALAGIPLAMNVSQVLAIDIGTDIWTAIAYAWQPKESQLMARKPRHPKLEKIVNMGVIIYSYMYIGILQTMCCWVFYFWAPGVVDNIMAARVPGLSAEEQTRLLVVDPTQPANQRASTLYYYVLVIAQIGAAVATTTYEESISSYGLPNKKLNICIMLEIVFAALIIYVPALQGIFNTIGLSEKELLIPWITFVFISICEEIRKTLVRKRTAKGREVNQLKVALLEEA